MDEASIRERLAHGRVATLATIDPDGRPNLVPCCFALDGDLLVSAVDDKPKSTMRLRRLANIRARPDVTLLVHAYEEDWDRIWWVRVRGRARVIEQGLQRDRAIAALQAKYVQYRRRPPRGPAVVIEALQWNAWRP